MDRETRARQLVTEQAAEWFVENRSGPLTEPRRQVFLDWLRASPRHVQEYLAISGVAQEMADAACRDTMPVGELLDANAREPKAIPLPVAAAATLPGEIRRSAGSLGRTWLRVAAIGVVACVLGGIIYAMRDSGERLVTGFGEERTLTLADDTVAHLNGDTTLIVRFDGQRRLIELQRGEVLFDVAHESGRPFQVQTGDVLMQDVGTSFNVLHMEQETVVTVIEGQVGVWDRPSAGFSAQLTGSEPPRALLSAADQARISGPQDLAVARNVDVRRATAWLRHEIRFDNERIAQVVVQFNRYNRVQMRLANERVAAMPISGIFNSRDVESFMQFLNGLPGVHAVLKDREVWIDSAATHAAH